MCNQRETRRVWDPRWMEVRREPMLLHLERMNRVVELAGVLAQGASPQAAEVLREAQHMRDQFAMLVLPAQ